MLNVDVLGNGNLSLSIEPAYLDDAQDEYVGKDYWSVMSDLFEPFSCNGSYTIFDAGEANPFVGLTSAPCIAEIMDVSDDGTRTIQGDFWYFDAYSLRNDLEELLLGSKVVYTLYQEQGAQS